MILMALAAVLAGLIGALISYLIAQRKITQQRQDIALLNAQLESEKRLHSERLSLYEHNQQQLDDRFASLSKTALQHNSDAFLKLAAQSFKSLQVKAESDLEKREQAVANLVTPIQQALDKAEKQIQQIEKERKESFGSITQQLRGMAEAQVNLQTETRNLVKALRRPEVRGQWGEMTLKRLVELAGMVEHCDFIEQASQTTAEGLMRPDMLIRMPESREIIVDAKTPLDAYLSAIESVDEIERKQHLEAHVRNLRKRIKELANKAYWAQFSQSPEFVVLFIPGEQFLTAALELNPELQEDALRQKVVLATPNNIIALLKTIAFGWRQQHVAENAEIIRQLGEELFNRIATFTAHLSKVGKSLSSSIDHYNKAVGSLERQLLPGARKFTELGIHPKKQIDDIDPLTTQPRPLQTNDKEQAEGK